MIQNIIKKLRLWSRKQFKPITDTNNTVGKVENKYVAFCDLLGFGNAILSDFDKVLEVYKDFNEALNSHRTIFSDVSLFSDAVVITSNSLGEVCSAVQILYEVCIRHGFLMRGGIGYGKHWKQMTSNDILLASEALVKAVRIEKEHKKPVIIIHPQVELTFENCWFNSFRNFFEVPILYYEGDIIVNPFGLYFYNTGIHFLENLKAQNPGFADKYDYLLGISIAKENNYSFVPPNVIKNLLDKGMIAPIGDS